MAGTLFKGLGKLAIGAGAVYVSVDQGVWGSSVDGARTLRSLSGTLQTQDEYLKQIPSSNQIAGNVREGWNSGVKWAFSSVTAGPEAVKGLSNKAVEYISGSGSK